MIVHLFDQVCQLKKDSLNAVSAMALVHCVSVRCFTLIAGPLTAMDLARPKVRCSDLI